MSLIESGSHTAISHIYNMYENLILVWRLIEHMKCGIYMILNKINNKIYIG